MASSLRNPHTPPAEKPASQPRQGEKRNKRPAPLNEVGLEARRVNQTKGEPTTGIGAERKQHDLMFIKSPPESVVGLDPAHLTRPMDGRNTLHRIVRRTARSESKGEARCAALERSSNVTLCIVALKATRLLPLCLDRYFNQLDDRCQKCRVAVESSRPAAHCHSPPCQK